MRPVLMTFKQQAMLDIQMLSIRISLLVNLNKLFTIHGQL